MASRQPNPAVHLMAGSICGGFSGVMLQPLDVIKTRLQTIEIPGGAYNHQPSKFTGSTVRSYSVGVPAPCTVRSTVSEIVRLHGVPGLWRGTSATLLRTFPGVGSYFFMLSQTKEMVKKMSARRDGRLTAGESIVAGASARSATGLLFFPLTLLKARLESGLFGYKGITGGFTTMYRSGGFVGMYKGVGATMMRDAPYSGAFVMAYELNKGLYRNANGHEAPTVVANLAIAVTSGMFACGITHPFDVIKTLVQVHPHRYQTTVAAFTETFAERGVRGFYRGFGARLCRKSAMAGITWTMYEQILAACTPN